MSINADSFIVSIINTFGGKYELLPAALAQCKPQGKKKHSIIQGLTRKVASKIPEFLESNKEIIEKLKRIEEKMSRPGNILKTLNELDPTDFEDWNQITKLEGENEKLFKAVKAILSHSSIPN